MKMMKLFLAISVVALLLSSCNSGSLSTTNASLKSEQDSVSFYIGYFFGTNLVASGLTEPNMQAVLAGMNTAIQKKQMDVDMQDVQMMIGNYMQKQSAKIAEANKEKGAKFLAENLEKEGVKALENGVQYKVITEGNGPKPAETDKVKVHYVGTLIDGTEFDSSIKRNEPAEFQLTQVIPGWTSALMEMPQGSKWIIYIPSELGYGQRGAGQNIGPNETLIFEVELLEIVESK